MTQIARPVHALEKPLPLKGLDRTSAALKTLYGPDLFMQDLGNCFVVFTLGERCGCSECDADLARVAPGMLRGMNLCPDCGNKRCPKATFHDNECTGSNEPGQAGSDYQ